MTDGNNTLASATLSEETLESAINHPTLGIDGWNPNTVPSTEEFLKEEVKEKKPEPSLLDLYANSYNMYVSPFCNYVDRLPLKSLRRIMKALAKYPLEIEEFTPHGDKQRREEEKHTFGVGHQVFFAKYMMVCLTQIEKEMKKAEQLNAEALASEETNKEGETNG